jgi:hypothetical protein
MNVKLTYEDYLSEISTRTLDGPYGIVGSYIDQFQPPRYDCLDAFFYIACNRQYSSDPARTFAAYASSFALNWTETSCEKLFADCIASLIYSQLDLGNDPYFKEYVVKVYHLIAASHVFDLRDLDNDFNKELKKWFPHSVEERLYVYLERNRAMLKKNIDRVRVDNGVRYEVAPHYERYLKGCLIEIAIGCADSLERRVWMR